MTEEINFDQSIDGIHNCIAFLLTMYPDNKLQYAEGIINRMNTVIFQDKKEAFWFYKQILLRILDEENQELSKVDREENKFAILDNLKIIKELKEIEK